MIKGIYKNSTTNIILKWKRFLKSETRQGCLLSLLFNFGLEVLAIVISQENRNKKHKDQEGTKKTVPICRCYDFLHIKSQRIYKIIELLSEFGKVAGYKVIIRKSTYFMC